jgi:hypothetical protein
MERIPAEIKMAQKAILQNGQIQIESSNTLKILQGKPFWIWNEIEHEKQYEQTHGNCCFWHIVGLPEKEHLVGKSPDGHELVEIRKHPIYDYEQEAYFELFKHRYIRIKKAAGMGMTTFFLGLIAWLCVRDDSFSGEQIVIVTGPRIDLAIEEVERLRDLFANTDYTPRKAGAKLWINGCKIEAYPSHTFNSARGLDRCRFFFVDEADFFPKGQQETVRTVVERYEAKSHPYIVFNSTTYLPGGLYEQMDNEKNPRFKTLEMFYEKGLGKIYTDYEIEQAKKMSSFEMEYNGQYGLGIGNIFPNTLLEKCKIEYDLSLKDGEKVLAVDPAYGSSKFAMVGVEKINGIIYVKEALQFDRPSPSAMLDLVKRMAKNYEQVVIDSAHPGIVTDLERAQIDVDSISFNKELSEMTVTAAQRVKERKVRIHPAFSDLMNQLKAVEFNDRGHPNKKKLSFDLGDAFFMAVHYLENVVWHYVSA